MKDLANGWSADVERGPNWLLVRLHAPCEGTPECPALADGLWSLLQEHLVHRLVLEMDEVNPLHNEVLDQLLCLHERLSTEGGMLRICGLSEENRRLLQARQLDARLPAYNNRREAVLGSQLCAAADSSH